VENNACTTRRSFRDGNFSELLDFSGEELNRLSQEDLEIRRIFGWTVAHELAACGILPERFFVSSVLELRNDDRITVAHVLAGNGFLPRRFFLPEILLLEDRDWETVALYAVRRIIREGDWDRLYPELLLDFS